MKELNCLGCIHDCKLDEKSELSLTIDILN